LLPNKSRKVDKNQDKLILQPDIFQWGPYATNQIMTYMGVDSGGFNICMTGKLLN
jgi:hypothetical protein